MTETSDRLVKCPMNDWQQVAPDRETALKLMSRHLNTSHRVDRIDQSLLAKIDAKLTHCPYVEPDGRWVP